MKVAILVFPGVEELDFVGFLEVLAVANRAVGWRYFDTELVGTQSGRIKCSGGLVLVPDRGLRGLKGHDMVFVPGGGASRGTGVDNLIHDERVLDLLRRTDARGKMVWSVCTGGVVLGAAGLLKGRRAVTHHAFFDRLAATGAKVTRKRTVLDGRIRTGGGIASSIDVGLELVKSKLGAKVLRRVKRSMEYPPPRA